VFKRFEKNEIGRDFVIGDIHGCFDAVRSILSDPGVQFDEGKDRLFSVGDLVDRGPDSIEAIDWIAKPWFHAVRGNHEQMAIGVAAGKHDLGNYLVNGGAWFLTLEDSRQQLVASVLDTLPVCIEVDTDDGPIGIVHADIGGNDWPRFVSELVGPISNNRRKAVLEDALWCRDRVQGRRHGEVQGITAMYVGHTPVNSPVVLDNVVYVDTGAVFRRSMTLICIQGQDVGQVVSMTC
jgi:serine/threonine protein phosphatase 1